MDVGHILAELLEHAAAFTSPHDLTETKAGLETEASAREGQGRYDFDLAEFPLFSLCRPKLRSRGRDPLVYSDTIQGPDGEPVTRIWKAYPGPFGFGGSSAQALLYDLLQLYYEQGARGSQIQFGTLRQLFLRRGERNPSKRDYDRMRRDIDILRGYDFHCEKAFYDHKRRAYIDMHWRLFESVFYFRPDPTDEEKELPFGFLEVSSVLREIARTRGFFTIGIENRLFHTLRPLEQRLAIYLAKKFVSQRLHQRFVASLARALPIQTSCERDTRKAIRSAAEGLLQKGVPILSAFRLEKSATGEWKAIFERGAAPQQDHTTVRRAAAALAPELSDQVERIVEAVGTDDDRLWWAQCAKRLGRGAVDRALGLLKERLQTGNVRSRGAMLTSIFKDIAEETGTVLN